MKILRIRHGCFTSLFSVLFVTIAGCSGGSGAAEENTPPPPPAAFGPNFSEIQSNIFTPTCATSGCHIGAGAPQGLRLDDANSYALLVGVASSEVPSVLRVAANDPANSYLIRKLEGTASVGAQMPLNAAALEQAVINILRQWITDGAIDDRATSADPVRVTSLSPIPGSELNAAPDDIVAMFDRELDVSTVNANTFVLEASGGDTTFGDGNETQITAAAITTPGTTPMSATFDLTGVALADDTYRVRLLGSGASLILDIDANALDGEFSGSFPSGDGAAGGDFEANFALTTAAMNPTLGDIQANVFSPSCAGCHSGPTSSSLPSGMDLSSADASFTSLVGVSSLQQPAISRVAAFDPDNSYLVQKIEGTAATGVRMPAGLPALDQAVIDNIRQWITDGANR
ncbi:MAG: hypothetical protein OEM99_12320 [Gammaproteobacteria bacterium]|nr:hypothetical protein [Gammaproteobacteria bacterium]